MRDRKKDSNGRGLIKVDCMGIKKEGGCPPILIWEKQEGNSPKIMGIMTLPLFKFSSTFQNYSLSFPSTFTLLTTMGVSQ